MIPPEEITLDVAQERELDEICTEFEAALRRSERPRIADVLDRNHEPLRSALLHELLPLEVEHRTRNGETPSAEEYRSQFPDYAGWISHFFECERPRSGHAGTAPAETGEWLNAETMLLPDMTRAASVPPDLKYIDRYRVERILGEGGFGRVYLARDDELDRHVAIKVPRPDIRLSPDHAAIYRREAQATARLEHPNIVPVYDVGTTDQLPIYLVSRYVKGQDLARIIQQRPLSYVESANLVASVGEALQSAHQQGLVHRDIKPANILVDAARQPFLVDFGLALREEDVGAGPVYNGTPAYMSPEQASGEGHRVDGRSDIFSLGIVLYELLVGKKPFAGNNSQEIMSRIATCSARPPRQSNGDIPAELERIVLKALARNPSDRYTTARDMAVDLRNFTRRAHDSPHKQRVDRGAKQQWQLAATIGVGCLAVATAVVVLGFLERQSRSDHSPRDLLGVSGGQGPATGELTATAVKINRFRQEIRRGEDDWMPVGNFGATPLRDGDYLKFLVELDAPGHIYVLATSTDPVGQRLVVYPGERADQSRAARKLALPENALRIQGDRSSTDSWLILVAPEPYSGDLESFAREALAPFQNAQLPAGVLYQIADLEERRSSVDFELLDEAMEFEETIDELFQRLEEHFTDARLFVVKFAGDET